MPLVKSAGCKLRPSQYTFGQLRPIDELSLDVLLGISGGVAMELDFHLLL
jgi:hypothetical protein